MCAYTTDARHSSVPGARARGLARVCRGSASSGRGPVPVLVQDMHAKLVATGVHQALGVSEAVSRAAKAGNVRESAGGEHRRDFMRTFYTPAYCSAPPQPAPHGSARDALRPPVCNCSAAAWHARQPGGVGAGNRRWETPAARLGACRALLGGRAAEIALAISNRRWSRVTPKVAVRSCRRAAAGTAVRSGSRARRA